MKKFLCLFMILVLILAVPFACSEEIELVERQSGEPVSPTGPCVQSFSAPLRTAFCPSDVGSVSFAIQSNGRLKVSVSLNSGFSLRRAFLHLDRDTPNADFEDYDFRFTSSNFTTSAPICRNNTRVRIRIALAVIIFRTGDTSDTVRAWAVAGSQSLPGGVSFSPFGRAFGGFFTVFFCPCPSSSCCPDPAGFQFVCGNRDTFRKCGGIDIVGTSRFCFCGFTPEGNNLASSNRKILQCLASRDTCPTTDCTKNSDCGPGQVCQLSSCCLDTQGKARNICNDLCKTQFPQATC